MDEYYGRWFEFARDPNYFEDAACTTAQYYELPNNYVSVNNHEYDPDLPESVQRKFSEYSGLYAECSRFQTGLCGVSPNYWFVGFAPYAVIDVELDSHSIVYSCTNYLGGAVMIEDLWILTREAIAIDTQEWISRFTKYSEIIAAKLPFFDQTTLMPT